MNEIADISELTAIDRNRRDVAFFSATPPIPPLLREVIFTTKWKV